LNECEEELPKTSLERKGTSLLINKEECSDKELGSDDENEENIYQDTHQDRNSTAPDDDKTSDNESYEEDVQ